MPQNEHQKARRAKTRSEKRERIQEKHPNPTNPNDTYLHVGEGKLSGGKKQQLPGPQRKRREWPNKLHLKPKKGNNGPPYLDHLPKDHMKQVLNRRNKDSRKGIV